MFPQVLLKYDPGAVILTPLIQCSKERDLARPRRAIKSPCPAGMTRRNSRYRRNMLSIVQFPRRGVLLRVVDVEESLHVADCEMGDGEGGSGPLCFEHRDVAAYLAVVLRGNVS
jgi:hypothetical protein